MSRAVVKILALSMLVALIGGVYGRFIRTPPPPPIGPAFVDTLTTPLTEADEFEVLAKTNPIAMYEQCLARYQREVKNGLEVTLVKRERIKGEPKPPAEAQEEVIHLAVRGDVPNEATGKPCIEVMIHWKSGARSFLGSDITATFYSEKEGKEGTGGKVVSYRSTAPFRKENAIAITDPLAKAQSRYCVRDAGIYRGMLRTYDAWKQRQEMGTLKTEYLGKLPIEPLGGRLCYVVERHCPAPEADAFQLGDPAVKDPHVIEREGFVRVRVMIDAETWMQVGSELYRPDGELLASYYFRDPKPNPTFAPDTFTKEGLKKK